MASMEGRIRDTMDLVDLGFRTEPRPRGALETALRWTYAGPNPGRYHLARLVQLDELMDGQRVVTTWTTPFDGPAPNTPITRVTCNTFHEAVTLAKQFVLNPNPEV